MSYLPDPGRYSHLDYRRCGRSGLLLPPVSLGLWHNFGAADDFENARQLIHGAFDAGITYFDLANNYGPPPGAAEECFGRIFMQDLSRFRDELVIATKAGHLMWAGPYGDWGSRKHMLSSLDQSLSRMKLDYVDIFYAHRHDPETPLEKTGNDFGVELPEEIDTDLKDMTITQEMLEEADTLKDMNLPKGTLVMIVKRGDEFLIPNGTLKLHVNDKLLLISEKPKEDEEANSES